MKPMICVLVFLAVCAAGVVSAQSSAVAESALRGKMVYEQHCLACHQADGSGVPSLAPPLVKGVFVDGDEAALIGIVLNGMEGVEIKGEIYANPMPSFAYLTNDEIADVLTYIRTNFRNKATPVKEEDVLKVREN